MRVLQTRPNLRLISNGNCNDSLMFWFLNNRLVGGVSVLLHRLLVERSIAVSACLLDPHSRPMKVDL